MNVDKNKIIFIGVALLASVVFVFYLAGFVVPKALVNMAKASGSQKMSTKNSFLLGEKILCKADGEEKCVVNVFVADSDGKGIAKKQVQLSVLNDEVKVTDSMGKASFELVSGEAKQYEITANINGLPLGKTVKVTFR